MLDECIGNYMHYIYISYEKYIFCVYLYCVYLCISIEDFESVQLDLALGRVYKV